MIEKMEQAKMMKIAAEESQKKIEMADDLEEKRIANAAVKS